jgi:hypothetical protein
MTTLQDDADLKTLINTRRSLHAIAECLLAGPEFRASGEIALRITPGGFGTTAGPGIRFENGDLVATDGEHVPPSGTYGAVAETLGIAFGAPEIGYADGSGASAEDRIELDPGHTRRITDWFALGNAALRLFAPDQTPVLWPEHFDVAVRVAGHSFGCSPGDDSYQRPYAYVSARDNDGSEFFNVIFGALRDADELPTTADLVAFWREGLSRLAG